jgi:GrpB-like predicted nucleotidyltransferase (UPF0157 family)
MPQNEPILLVAYDSSWPDKFEKEKELLEGRIGKFVIGGIHHFGSTAIPGLSAKPIIDIMVGVASLEASKPAIELLAALDYQYSPYKTDEKHWFCKPAPSKRTHHLHLIAVSHPEFKAKLAFRDYLRTHQKERDAYERLKILLAKKFKNDREAYTSAKSDFIKSIVSKASQKV